MSFELRLDNLSCEIEDRRLFSGISATFQPGDLIQIVGPNGAGKTTLLRILTGLSYRYEGKVFWNDKAVPCYEYLSSLLYIGHAIGVNESMTPRENLAWYFGLNGAKGESFQSVSVAEIDEALKKVGLKGYGDVPCHHMSAGQKRRVAIARLHISKAPVWILDEPLTAIDKQGVAELEERIQQHREAGGMVVLTTHQSLHHINPKVIDLADYLEDHSIAASSEGVGGSE